MRESIKLPAAKSLIIIFLCFLLTSTGWLGWTYHLGNQISAGALDVMSMVVGYLLQAAGTAVDAIVNGRKMLIRDDLLPFLQTEIAGISVYDLIVFPYKF